MFIVQRLKWTIAKQTKQKKASESVSGSSTLCCQKMQSYSVACFQVLSFSTCASANVHVMS